MTAAAGSRRTLADELRLALADDIVRGLLVPGSALDETDLEVMGLPLTMLSTDLPDQPVA